MVVVGGDDDDVVRRGPREGGLFGNDFGRLDADRGVGCGVVPDPKFETGRRAQDSNSKFFGRNDPVPNNNAEEALGEGLEVPENKFIRNTDDADEEEVDGNDSPKAI